MTFDLLWQMLFILVLVGFNAFFAASEIAIISLNNTKVERMAEEGNKKAQIILRLIKEPSRFLATIQVGITLSGFLASASASESFSGALSAWIISLGLPIPQGLVRLVSLIVVVGALTYVTLVLGELVPKRIALQKYESISMSVAKPVEILAKITFPFVRLLTASTNILIKALGGDPNANEEKITEEEIMMMVDVGEEKGVIKGTEKEMIENIFEFDNTPVSNIMTRRTDIAGIPIGASLDEVVKILEEERFTRMPVYEETIDNIVGILYSKDMISVLKSTERQGFDLSKLIRKPYFVPESKKTDELFKELKQSKNHIAVVIDEYGGTAGIVTMEDLIEEVVGNIFDEYDEVEKEIDKIDENTFMLDGLIRLEEVQDHFDITLPVDEYETLSGFLIGQLGRIPDDHEKPVIEFGGLVFRIEEVESKTVAKVKVCRV